MSDIKFKFVQQPTPRTCVHACLSMVTGVPVESLIERFGDTGLLFECEVVVLIENGIFPDTRYHSAPVYEQGFYLVTAPSLNRAGELHRVVVEVNKDDDFIVHDPNTGRSGVRSYPPNAMHGGEPGMYIIGSVGLDTSMLRRLRLAGATNDQN